MARPVAYAAWLGIILSLAALGYQALRQGQPLEDAPGLPPVVASPMPVASPTATSVASPAATPAPSGVASPTPAPTASPASTQANSATPPRPSPVPSPVGRVLASGVESVELPAAGYASEARTMEIADSGVIDPPDFTHVWWVRDRGVPPGRGAADTAYLACHTHSRRTADEVPCNKISPERIPAGSEIHVTTDVERLTYMVTSVKLVDKDEFANDPEIWGVHPGRLVWVTCYLENGKLSQYNAVVIAELVP